MHNWHIVKKNFGKKKQVQEILNNYYIDFQDLYFEYLISKTANKS